MEMKIRAMKEDDWTPVQEIYVAGIATGVATFESAAPVWQEWHESHLDVGRLVATIGTKVVGWAALSSVAST